MIASRRARAIRLAQFDQLNARGAALRSAGHAVISLGQAIPGFGPPPVAAHALSDAVGQPDSHLYSSDAGLERLRTLLCARLAETAAVDATPADVIITAGGNQAFFLAMSTLLDTGDEVVLPSPYFANHEMAIRAVGGTPIEAPLVERDGFAPVWEAIEPHLTPATRAVVICNPSNPTGAVCTRAELERIAGELHRRGLLLVTDETYMHFVHDAATHTSAAALPAWRDYVVVVGTFSKSFGITGWRVGYLLADAAICEQALKIQDTMVICAPVPSQLGVAAAVDKAWTYPRSFGDELAERRRILRDELASIPRLRWVPTSGGFFAFVHVDGCTDSAQMSWDILERAHVITIPGAIFGVAGEGFLRLSYGAAPAEALHEGMLRLRRYFADD